MPRILKLALVIALITTSAVAAPPGEAVPASFEQPAGAANAAARKHVLWPALKLASDSLAWIDANVRDYTCDMVRRERIGSDLRPYEYAQLKVRHQQRTGDEVTTPFSVYLNFTKPASIAGREVLYIEGQHAGRMFVKRGGKRLNQLTAFVNPTSTAAMRENRYPITEVGFRNMTQQLIDRIEDDLSHQEVQVKFFKNAKVGDRVCTRIEVIHPEPRPYFTYHKAMIFVDDERHLPVGFASFGFPAKAARAPVLLEEYVFTNVKLNVGLTDVDFDRENPAYGFNRYSEPDQTKP